jgi:hypothetical protein
MKELVKIKAILKGWRINGIVLQPTCVNKSDVIDMLENKNITNIFIGVELEEPKNIQMTTKEFEDLINIIETWDNPVAELRSRLKNNRYRTLVKKDG